MMFTRIILTLSLVAFALAIPATEPVPGVVALLLATPNDEVKALTGPSG